VEKGSKPEGLRFERACALPTRHEYGAQPPRPRRLLTLAPLPPWHPAPPEAKTLLPLDPWPAPGCDDDDDDAPARTAPSNGCAATSPAVRQAWKAGRPITDARPLRRAGELASTRAPPASFPFAARACGPLTGLDAAGPKPKGTFEVTGVCKDA
jgi:hypothetical protein